MQKARVVAMWFGAAVVLGLLAFGSHAISAEGTPPSSAEGTPPSEKTVLPQAGGSDEVIDVIDAVTQTPEGSKTTAEHFACTHSGVPVAFPVYSAGPQVGRWKLTHIMRYCAPAPEGGEVVPDYVSYLYGRCDVAPNPITGEFDGGCPLPIQVQTWAACERSRADLTEITPESSEVLPGGAVMDRSEDGHQAEIFTAASTIVVYASNADELETVAASLRLENPNTATESVSVSARAETSLPAPSPGAMKGALSCNG